MTDYTPRAGEPDQPGDGQGGRPESQPGYGPPPGYGPGQQPPPAYGPPPGYGQQPAYGQPPAYGPQPGYGQQPGYGPPPGYGQGGWNTAGAPQPGGIPLRPLGLGDILNGAVTVIRRNPAATVGLAAIVLSVTGVATTALSIAVSGTIGSAETSLSDGSARLADLGNFFGAVGTLLAVSAVLGLIAEIFLTGLLTVVIGRGVLGQEVGIGQAWRLVRPRLAAVFGVTFLGWIIVVAAWIPYAVVLAVLIAANLHVLAAVFGVLGFLAMVALTVVVWIRLSLAAPVVVLERARPVAALRRSWALVSGSFWRLLGIFLLTVIIVTVAGLILQLPFDFVKSLVGGGFSTIGASASVASIIVSGIGSIAVGALTRPLLAGVTVLLYVDLRMRKEGLDLVLRDAAQNQQLTGDAFAGLWRAPAPGQGPPVTSRPTAW